MPELGIGLGISKGAVPKTKLLLDKYDIDAAFSLRKVRAEYNGPCVRVRNSSGDFADIGFTSSGVLDEAALNAHCGDNDGTVQTWYNQSTEGGRYNAVQDTAAAQPIIYDASAGGYLGYVENTGNRYLRFENQLTGVTDLGVVYENVSSTTSSAYVLGEHREDNGQTDGVSVGHPNFPGFSVLSNITNISSHTGSGFGDKHAGFVYTNTSTSFTVVDGYVVASRSDTFNSLNIDYIFSRSKDDNPDSWDFLGKVWEVFLSTSDLSDKRIQLENSILSANGLTVPEQTLLEKHGEDGLAVSTRCLNREYVGPILRVRNETDHALRVVVDEDNLGDTDSRIGIAKTVSGVSNSDSPTCTFEIYADCPSVSGNVNISGQFGGATRPTTPTNVPQGQWTSVSINTGTTTSGLFRVYFAGTTLQTLDSGDRIYFRNFDYDHANGAGDAVSYDSDFSSDVDGFAKQGTESGDFTISGGGESAANRNVYLQSDGTVNTTRIEELCTVATDEFDGFVQTWYDQSGGGNDVSNTDGPTQPKIYDETDGVVLANGLPSIQFSNGTGGLSGYTPANGGFSVYCVAIPEQTDSGAHHIYGTQSWTGASNGNWFFGVQGGATSSIQFRSEPSGGDAVLIQSSSSIAEDEMFVASIFVSEEGAASLFKDSAANGSVTGASVAWDSTISPRISAPTSGGTRGFEGKISELIIFEKDTSSVRTSVEDNINKHYLVYQEATASPATGLLADYSGAAAAYSVRQLGDANICMKVRRDGDDAEKNIGFGSDGFVDTTAISDFCGSDDGFVVTWFDQSGNAVDATQGTNAEQPKIYDGTDGVVLENGKPAIQADGDASSLTHSAITRGKSHGLFAVCGPATDWGDVWTSGLTLRSHTQLRVDYGGQVISLSVSGLLDEQQVLSTIGDGSSITAHKNGTETTAGAVTITGTNTTLSTMLASLDDGKVQELIFYQSDQSSNRTGIESDINDAFDIYPSTETPTSGFLGEFSGAAAAYSVRKLGDSPVAMRVRKTVSSVDYYQVIGFDANGDLDTAAIEEFGGSNDVFVQTWYDQSGNGRHQVQDTNAEQPKIYDGTDGFYYTEGNVAIFFDDQGMEDSSDNQITVLDQSVFAVAEMSSTVNSERCVFVGHTEDATYQVFAAQIWGGADNETADEILNYAGTAQVDRAALPLALDVKQNLRTYGWHHDSDSIFQYNGEEYTPDDSTVLAPTQSTYQISVGSKSYNPLNAYVTEVIVFEGMRDATTRANIEKDQNNYFLVHQEASASPATGLLSEAPGAKVAFSTRQLGDALLCMKVVSDATGNPTKNIGFKNGELDTAAIEEFCGTNIGRVETWYDQSGNGNDLTPIESNRAWVDANGNATTFGAVGTGDKPIVFMPDGSSNVDNYRFSQGFVRVGGKPAVKFRSRLMATESLGDQLRAAFSVMKKEGANSQFVYYLNPYAYLAVAGGASPYHEGYNVQASRGHIGGNGSPIDEETSSSSTFFGVTNDSTVINGKDVILSHKADEPTNASTSDYMVMGGRFTSAASINASQPIVAEFIGYTDSVDFDDTRDIVETNMNSRHKIFKKFSTGLLDQYPGAVGAYSLRRLSSTYNGPLIRVVDTENGSAAEYDIYANGEGDLEINQIYNSAGGRASDANTSVSVVKWYDQSGNGNHVEQSQVGNAPEIKATTELVTRDGLRPALEFDSSSWLSSTTVTNTGEATAYVVANADDTSVNKAIFFVPEVFAFLTNAEVLQLYSGITSEAPSGDTTQIETNDTLVKNLIFFGNDGSTTFGGVNGQAFVTEANVPNSNSGYDKIKIGANATNTINFDGTIQEAVYYNSDQRSVRAGIEKNVNAYYEAFDEPLLDVVPDAAAAYSLRKLRAGYTGPAINVYNGTDYKDIYFRSDGTLDTGAISRFCGSNDGTVAIWYDQSGESNHAEQTTAANRPKIYDGTTGLVTENGKPAVEFDPDNNTVFNISESFSGNNLFGFSVVNDQTSVDGAVKHVWSNLDTFNDGVEFRVVNSYSQTVLALNNTDTILTHSSSGQILSVYGYDGSTATLAVDGGSATTASVSETISVSSGSSLGGRITPSPISAVIEGTMQEFVLYTSDQSSNRSVAEANINYYYGIY